MSFLMFSEPGLPGEGLPTYVAPMRFLSCMNSLVIYEARFLNEVFPTFTAYMGFIYLLSPLRLMGQGVFIYRINTFRKFHFSMMLLMICMEERFRMSINLNWVLYFTASVLVDQTYICFQCFPMQVKCIVILP